MQTTAQTLRNQLLPPKKAAELTKPYGIGETALRRMVRNNEIPGIIYAGTKALINMRKLFEYLGLEQTGGGDIE